MFKKRNLFYFINFVILTIFASCSGTVDEDIQTGNGGNGLSISASKTEIEADGKDEVEFTVYYDGVDVTSKAYVKDLQAGSDLKKNSKGKPYYTAIANGEYEFRADYKGEQSIVKVTAKNRKLYEEFYRQVAVFKITSTHCINCPSMTSALNTASEKMPGRLVKMAFHCDYDNQTDPYSISLTDGLNYAYSVVGLPTTIYNLNVVSSDRTNITSIINQELRDNPATCGIKANATYDGSKITVDASMKTSTGGEYDLVYIVLQDSLSGSGYYEEVYNYTVIAGTTNYLSFSDSKKTLSKGEEATFPSVSFDIPKNIYDRGEVKVAVYALTKKNDVYIVDNIIECNVNGGLVDYKYND